VARAQWGGDEADERLEKDKALVTEPPKDFVSPQERLAGQDWSGVAKTGIASMTPGDKGWVLAVVIIIAVLAASDYFSLATQHKRFSESILRTMDYLGTVEANRQKINEIRADEMRRMQEVMKEMVQTVVRQAERSGRTQREGELIEKAKE
jgi:hypothetical protein